MIYSQRIGFLFAASFCFLLTSCLTRSPQEVVVYCALDREFSEPILHDFEQQTGIRVLARYDVESTKSVGLTNLILQEQARPRCDLFWNNEVLNTLRLKRAGLLQASLPRELSRSFPGDAERQWSGFAARARVLLVNTELVAETEWPSSIDDLNNPRWQGKVGMAKPLFGTTATHAAVLFATRGESSAEEFFRLFKANGKILSGNKQVAEAVASGQLAFGITDTDDAILELDAGRPVRIIFPDQGQDQSGALLIPNTVCLPKNTAHPAAALQLATYLLTAKTEDRLAQAASAQIPVHPAAQVRPRVLPETSPKWMTIDYEAAADQWERSQQVLQDLFTGP